MRAKLIVIAGLLVFPLVVGGYAFADSGGRSDAAKAQSATARMLSTMATASCLPSQTQPMC